LFNKKILKLTIEQKYFILKLKLLTNDILLTILLEMNNDISIYKIKTYSIIGENVINTFNLDELNNLQITNFDIYNNFIICKNLNNLFIYEYNYEKLFLKYSLKHAYLKLIKSKKLNHIVYI
jgi:hypothetical protein